MQKWTATILVAVLALVYIEQALHRHEYKPTGGAQQGIAVGYDYSTCSLCDFQLAAADQLPDGPQCALPFTWLNHSFAPLPEPFRVSFFQAVPGRGPPMG